MNKAFEKETNEDGDEEIPGMPIMRGGGPKYVAGDGDEAVRAEF